MNKTSIATFIILIALAIISLLPSKAFAQETICRWEERADNDVLVCYSPEDYYRIVNPPRQRTKQEQQLEQDAFQNVCLRFGLDMRYCLPTTSQPGDQQ